jgi:hypothetical protein
MAPGRHSNTHSTSPPFPDWLRVYQPVLTETDTNKLFKLVEIAEAAVLTRRAALNGSADYQGDKIALDEAVAHLQFVKRERLNFR